MMNLNDMKQGAKAKAMSYCDKIINPVGAGPKPKEAAQRIIDMIEAGKSSIVNPLLDTTGKIAQQRFDEALQHKTDYAKGKIKRILTKPKSPLDTQVAGSHYKDMAIQPILFMQKNGLNYCEAAVVKYVCRHRNKNGAEDIKKAIHLLQILLEIEYEGK